MKPSEQGFQASSSLGITVDRGWAVWQQDWKQKIQFSVIPSQTKKSVG